MMTPISKKVPASPRAAARRRAAVDRRLDTELFRALADPTRAKLLACLVKCGRPCSVSEIAACCAVDFSVVARHLGLLARADVLDVEKKGRNVWYRARCTELSARLRALAEAIDEWCPASGCGTGSPPDSGCCAASGANPRVASQQENENRDRPRAAERADG